MQTSEVMSRERLDRYVDEAAKTTTRSASWRSGTMVTQVRPPG